MSKLLKKEIPTDFLLIPYCIILLLSYFVTGNLFLEWVVSFMPYFLVVNICLIAFLWSRKQSFAHIVLYFVTFLMLVRFIDFSFVKPPVENGDKELNVVFINKLIFNTQFDEIDKKIKAINPDILGTAEMDEFDAARIPVLKEYPYTYFTQTPNNASLALFSKYRFSVEDSSFSPYVLSSKMYIDGKNYMVLIIHPKAPVFPNDFSLRDAHIKKLSAYIESLKSKRILLLGDFNLTPWSPVYNESLGKLQNMKNAAKGTGLHTTYQQGPFQVLIDHIFVSNEFKVESFKSEYVEGSDHKLIWTVLKI